jgi:small-conductance mechanosensitive channel
LEQGFWEEHGDLIGALITIGVSFLVAFIVDRVIIGRTKRLAARVSSDRGVTLGVSRAAQTRLRLVRRLVFLLILLIGFAFAFRNIRGAEKLATGILASSAVLGLVLGFAARQSVANLVAGVVLAVAQPIRIGDRITFGDPDLGIITGRVDDVTLTFTYIDTGDGRLLVIPNEHVVTDAIFNHSTGNLSAPVIADLWMPPDGDVGAARRALDGIAEQVEVAEITHEGVRLRVTHKLEGERTRVGGEEAALRERGQSALREAGLLAEAPS